MKLFGRLVFALVFTATGFAQEEIIDAVNLEALRAKDGMEVTVEGTVIEIGTTRDSSITFINIGAPKKQGFAALVFRKDYAAFPEGFDQYRNQKVRVKGLLKLYRGETPQIALNTPEQISVVTEQ